jgi:hypothetical protein
MARCCYPASPPARRKHSTTLLGADPARSPHRGPRERPEPPLRKVFHVPGN